MAEPIIQLKNVTKRFGAGEEEVAALEDISIAVQPGEIFGVIGLSGAGKAPWSAVSTSWSVLPAAASSWTART